MNTDPVTMGEFVMEVQNARNMHPMRPQPCENLAAWVVAQYMDDRLGAVWELLAGYDGQLRFRRGAFDPADELKAFTWEKQFIRIGKPNR